MPFEVFDKRTAAIGDNPFVTIQRRGPLSLNHAAFNALGKPRAVELLYDPDERIIGMRQVSSSEPRAFSVRPQGTSRRDGRASNYMIAGQAFTKHYGIDTKIARRYAAQMRDGMLTVDLKQEGVDATGPRAKERSRTS